MDFLKEGLQYDLLAKSLITLLYTKGRRLCVPKLGNLRKNLIKECHDTKWAGVIDTYFTLKFSR